jgi:hypothetical protein
MEASSVLSWRNNEIEIISYHQYQLSIESWRHHRKAAHQRENNGSHQRRSAIEI